MRPKHTEAASVEGEEAEIGRDPRKMTADELVALGHPRRPLLQAVRANCIECCCGSQVEVRRCRMVACPMWPFRMGTNPFNTREMTEEQRAAASARMRGLVGRQMVISTDTITSGEEDPSGRT